MVIDLHKARFQKKVAECAIRNNCSSKGGSVHQSFMYCTVLYSIIYCVEARHGTDAAQTSSQRL